MFTEIFNNLLVVKDITAYKIAKAAGISQGLMNEYKNGVKLPTIQNLVKIADSLDCSVDYLLGRTDVVEVNRKRATFADYGELAALGGIDNPKPPKKKPETT